MDHIDPPSEDCYQGIYYLILIPLLHPMPILN